MKRAALSFAVLLAALAASGPARAEHIEWKDVPAPAQGAILGNAQGFKPYMVEKETAMGLLMYEAIVIKRDNSKIIIKVGPLGQIYDVRSRATLF